jgi:hypothetical protein
MKDVLGNRLEPGNLVLWHLSEWAKQRGLVAEVSAISEPKIVGRDGAPDAAPHLVLRIVVPVTVGPRGDEPVGPRGDEPQLPDFIRLVSPAQQALVEGMVVEIPGRKQ